MFRSFKENSIDAEVMLEALREDGQVNVGFVDEGDTVRVVASEGKFWELLNAASKLENDRQSRYKDYDIMEEDPIISGTLEMVVDDCTQYSQVTNSTMWVEGQHRYKKDIENFLSDIDFENRVWGWVYNIAKYGDFFPKLSIDKEGRKGIISISEDTHPKDIYRLDVDGKLSGFLEKEDQKVAIKQEDVYGSSDFVHFVNNYRPNFEKIKIKVKKHEKGNEGDQISQENVITEKSAKPLGPGLKNSIYGHVSNSATLHEEDYEIKTISSMYGTSILQNARKIYRIVNLLENAVAIARLARTPVIRVYYVNTVGMDKIERKEMMGDLEEKFGMKKSFNLEKDAYEYKYHPLSYVDDVFIPVSGEKGDIRTEQIGGDVNIRDISDLEYYRNKLFAALRVPKAYLGFEETIPGSMGSNTLTRLDIRYGRMCKKVQRALIEGMYRVIQINLAYKYNTEVDISDISLAMVPVSTAEEDSQLELQERRMGIASSLFNFMTDLEGKIDTQYYIQYIFNDILSLQGLDVAKLVKKEAEPVEAFNKRPRDMKQFLEKVKNIDPEKCEFSDILKLLKEQVDIFIKQPEIPKNRDLKIPALSGRRINAFGKVREVKKF